MHSGDWGVPTERVHRSRIIDGLQREYGERQRDREVQRRENLSRHIEEIQGDPVERALFQSVSNFKDTDLLYSLQLYLM
jgi:hypothetical protein